MRSKRIKQYLMLLLAIGVVSIAAGGGNGTFASFSAEATNAGNTFSNGTLYLQNTNGSTTCNSNSQVTTTFNYKEDCFALFSAQTLSNTVIQKVLTLTNTGTIPASDIKFAVANCTVTTTDGAANPPFVTLGTGATQFGCDKVDLAVQEVNAASLSGTNVYCAYATAASACSLSSATLASSQAAGLTALKTTGGATATLAASASRYYIINIQPDTTNFSDANALQDVKLTFDLQWHIDQ